MNDVLAVAIGVVIGMLVSVPMAIVIAVSTTPRPVRLVRDRDELDVIIEPPTTAVVIYNPENLEVLNAINPTL